MTAWTKGATAQGSWTPLGDPNPRREIRERAGLRVLSLKELIFSSAGRSEKNARRRVTSAMNTQQPGDSYCDVFL